MTGTSGADALTSRKVINIFGSPLFPYCRSGIASGGLLIFCCAATGAVLRNAPVSTWTPAEREKRKEPQESRRSGTRIALILQLSAWRFARRTMVAAYGPA